MRTKHSNNNSTTALDDNFIRYGKPKGTNDAIIKDLINNNYQVEFLQQQK